MQRLVVLGLVGLVAQLVDGALGMGYGATSATLLLATGLTPVIASASIHLAEIGTTLASATAHTRLGNVHWGTVNRMAVPGAVGAFVGAVSLTRLSAEVAGPLVAVFLFGLGAVILARFSRPPRRTEGAEPARDGAPQGAREGARGGAPQGAGEGAPLAALAPLGLVAGFFDAVGGGGWGPISTSTLLVRGRMVPRRVVGSVDTSEFLVTVAASAGFLAGLGTDVIAVPITLALLAGGLVAAPVAAWVVKALPAHLLGVLIGAVILLTNVRTLTAALAIPGPVAAVLTAAVVAAVAAALVRAAHLRRRALERELVGA